MNNFNAPVLVENLFFAVTCVSTFTCVIRSDYNFAVGLLCYYMIKTAKDKGGSDLPKVSRTVSQVSSAHHSLYLS